MTDEYRDVPTRRFSRVFVNRARGHLGMEVSFRGEVLKCAPTRMLAGNLRFDRALRRFLSKRAAEFGDFRVHGRLRAFSARQYLLPDGTDSEPTVLFRGSTLVDPAPSLGEDRAAALADGIGQWMLRNLADDGAIPYKYWPSRGKDSPADNAIRRFLGTISLARLGKLRMDAAILKAAQRNLRYNLARYFKDIGGGRGAIVEPAGAKLGASALAGLAILESSEPGEFARELELLASGVKSLEHDELGFRTFFFPEERDGDNWNFYAGEALLFWAEAARRELPFAPSLKRCAELSDLCRDRHRKRRNPAFIPWHTQACASLYRQTRRREFADFVFEMNDWLLPMQQWDGLDADLQGRFYDPRHPEFGPPHAASTGVYLEGLADAAALAGALGEKGRLAAYRRAIGRGLRSLRQLQFRDERDAFYVHGKHRVMGALRTEAYDNAVRLDSAAHALLAAIKIIGPMDFGAG